MPDATVQGASESPRGRLARISHHFLGGERATRVLVLSAEAGAGDLSPNGLARAFARLGVTSAVLDGEGLAFYAAAPPGGRSLRLEPRLTAERLKGYWEACRAPAVLLGRADDAPLDQRMNLLISLPVDDAGMRRAFLRLKALAGVKPPSVGATVVGAADRCQAEAAYERFAGAANRFLGLAVASYSYLPAPTPLEDRAGRDFDSIAMLLLDDWRDEPREDAGRDAAPSPTIAASEEIV
jgi:hypothetical protein